jgi:hypothetical protein
MSVIVRGLISLPELNLSNLSFTYEPLENEKIGLISIIGISQECFNKIRTQGFISRAYADTSKGKLTFFELMFLDFSTNDVGNIQLFTNRYTQGAFFLDSYAERSLDTLSFQIADFGYWVGDSIFIEEQADLGQVALKIKKYSERLEMNGYKLSILNSLSIDEKDNTEVTAGHKYRIYIHRDGACFEDLVNIFLEFKNFITILTHCSFDLSDIFISKKNKSGNQYVRYSGDFRDNLYRYSIQSNKDVVPIDFSVMSRFLLNKFVNFHTALPQYRRYVNSFLDNLKYDPFNQNSFFQLLSNIENYLDTIEILKEESLDKTKINKVITYLKKSLNEIEFISEKEASTLKKSLIKLKFAGQIDLAEKLKIFLDSQTQICEVFINDFSTFIKTFIEKRNSLAHARKPSLTYEEERILYNQSRKLQFAIMLLILNFDKPQIISIMSRIETNRILGFDYTFLN